MENTQETATRVFEVDGLTITVDTAKAGSWNAFRYMRDIADEETNDAKRVASMFALIESATDTTEAAIVEHCGGGDAPFSDVFHLASKIIAELYPKN